MVVASTPAGRSDLGSLTYVALDRLMAGATAIGPDTPLVVATVTDVLRVDRGTRFGNLLADLIRTRLTQRGMTVSEPRLRATMRMAPSQGEFMLGRDTRHLVPPPAAAALLTGTYATGGRMVYVSLKLVSASNGRILSAADFAVPRFPDADELLRDPEPAPLRRVAAPQQD